MKTISIANLRTGLAAVIDAVKSGTPIQVTRINIPVAVIVPASWYEMAIKRVAEPHPDQH